MDNLDGKWSRWGAVQSHEVWFDRQVFEDWFISLMLPILKRQEGTKVVIGDNLSSHISLEVLHLCEENSIKFIPLPPTATHLLQPLDVAFFHPLKSHWREVLTNWKKTPLWKVDAQLLVHCNSRKMANRRKNL